MKYELVEYHIKPQSENILENINRFIICGKYKNDNNIWETEKYIATLLNNNNIFSINNIFNTINSKTTLYHDIRKIINIYLTTVYKDNKFIEKYFKEYYINNINYIELSQEDTDERTIINSSYNHIYVKLISNFDYFIGNKIIEQLHIEILNYRYEILYARDNNDKLKNTTILEIICPKDAITLDKYTAYIIIEELFKNKNYKNIKVNLNIKKILNIL